MDEYIDGRKKRHTPSFQPGGAPSCLERGGGGGPAGGEGGVELVCVPIGVCETWPLAGLFGKVEGALLTTLLTDSVMFEVPVGSCDTTGNAAPRE